jgi:hypothetical protein
MPSPRETLIQLYLEGGLSPESRREFERLSRKDPSFSNEVTEAVQRAFRRMGTDSPSPKILTAPQPKPVPSAARATNATVSVSLKSILLKFRPWIGLGLMGLAALGLIFLLGDWARQALKHKPTRARISREGSRPESKSFSAPIRQVMVQALLTPAVREDAIGVSPSLSAAGKELVFQEGDRIYLSIESDRKQSVTLSVARADGTLIRRLYDGEWQKGMHEMDWDGMDESGHPVPPGIYSVVLKAGSKTMSDRLVIQPAS